MKELSLDMSLIRRSFLAVALILLLPLVQCAPVPAPIARPKVVIFTPVSFDILDESIAGIREGLNEAGYGDTRLNLSVVNAGGQMQLLPSYAREILSAQPAIVVPVSTPATQAVVNAASETQGIVFSTVTDPASADVPATSTHITGVSDVVDYAANIDLLISLFPNVSSVGTIYNPSDAAAVFGFENLKPILAAKNITLVGVAASNSNDAVTAARSLIGRVDAIYIGSDSNASAGMPGIAAVTTPAGVPVIASTTEAVRNGALAAIAVDYRDLGRATAALIIQALNTERPVGEIPRVAFVGRTLTLNTNTARLMHYQVPAAVMARRPVTFGD